MTGVAAEEQVSADGEGAAQPYARSWVDRLTAWVAELPVPSWLFYAGLGLVLFFLQTIVLWIEGAFPFPEFDRAHAFLAAGIPYLLALIHYLDERAGAALAGMRSDLTVSAKDREGLDYQLTTMPALPALLAGLTAVLCALLIEELAQGPFNLRALETYPVSAFQLRIVYLTCWWVFGTFLYHTFNQLRMISRVYTQHTRINLFRMKSLYAFSNLAALTAGSLVLLPYGFLYVNLEIEMMWEEPVLLTFYLFVTFFAILTFIWPQLGIHRLQISEKERLLDEANQRFEATIADLHQRIDGGKLEGIFDLSAAMGGLETEKTALGKIPTWPWEPEVVRLLITALALPLGLWALQYVLQRLVGS